MLRAFLEMFEKLQVRNSETLKPNLALILNTAVNGINGI